MKKIIGISDLVARRAPGVGVTRRFACTPRGPRRLAPAAVGWGTCGALDLADQIFRRWSWQVVDAASRRDPTEEDLRWLEEEIGAELPPDYRLFLGAYGWIGFPEALRFPLREVNPFGADAEGEDTLELDEDQILRRWETLFPERRLHPDGVVPQGFTNVYAVADSFATFLGSLYRARL